MSNVKIVFKVQHQWRTLHPGVSRIFSKFSKGASDKKSLHGSTVSAERMRLTGYVIERDCIDPVSITPYI